MLAGAALIVGLAAARFSFRWPNWWERPLARVARHRNAAILIAALSPMLIRVALLPLFPVRAPRVHDEFSFLLGADTLAHGRLANPQHAMWVHFESEHILATPVYASAFPLGPAAAVAVGQIISGIPWVGVWLSAGIMCGAICWMLQGWLPPRWALLGAFLVVLRIGISSYWMNSYWGGCVAAAGGALVLGALPRIIRKPAWPAAVAMGAGCLILAHSRAFEGAVFVLIVAVPLVWNLLGRNRPPAGMAIRQVWIPLSILLAFTAATLAYDSARVTGKFWVAPYVQYRLAMAVAPHFLWQKPTPEPLYNNRDLRQFYVDREMYDYNLARAFLLNDLWRKTGGYGRFYAGPILLIPLIAAFPWLWKDRRTRALLLMSAAFSLALLGQVWHNAHYAAPATGLATLVIVSAMRRLRLWRWRGRRAGVALAGCVPLACAAMLLVQIAAGQLREGAAEQTGWRWTPPGGVARANIQKQLAATNEKHLILVRYSTQHESGDEWVYNAADIDASPVVWARELDRASNEKLFRYFKDRKTWLVEPDATPPRAIPYQDAAPRPMRFVQLGAPGIDVLRSPDEVRGKVLETAGGAAALTCDQWNFFFTAATDVQGPVTGPACYGGSDRTQAVAFERWFNWLEAQR
jgi:hypothetical protein